MLILALSLILAAAPSEGVRLAAPSFSYANLDEKTGELFLDSLTVQLGKQGAQVLSQKEIAAVVGLERQKQIMGCSSDGSACMAELADALGVDGILTGSIGKTSGGYLCTLKIVASSSGKTLAADTTRVKTDDELLDWFETAAGRLVRDMRKALGKSAVAQAEVAPEPVAAKQDPEPAAKSPTAAVVAPASGVAAATGVEVLWKRKWYPARILEKRADGAVLIHYEGYSDAWNEWVTPGRLRMTGAAANTDGTAKPEAPAPAPQVKPQSLIEVEWNGSWYKATVLETRANGDAFIKFDGYSDSWNEWVPPSRMRARSE